MANTTGLKFGGRKKGSKNKATLLKEERRAMFDMEVSKTWLQTIKDLVEKEPKYVADQFIDKPQERIDLTSGGEKVSGVVFLPKKNGTD